MRSEAGRTRAWIHYVIMSRSQRTHMWPAQSDPRLPLSAIRDPMHACACSWISEGISKVPQRDHLCLSPTQSCTQTTGHRNSTNNRRSPSTQATHRPKTTDPLTPLTPLPSRSHTGQSAVRHLSGRTHMMHQVEGHGTSMRRVSLESHTASPINLLSDAIPTSDARGQEWRKKGR